MSYTTRSVISRNVWDDGFDFPSRIRDQHFGLGLTDLDLDAPSSFYRGYYLRPRRQLSSGGLSEIKAESDKFQVRLDVGHFAPEDIVVKTVDDQVVVTAKHEEKVDEHGFISREFTRRYVLPESSDLDKVTSTLSADGILIVEAPRKKLQPALGHNERAVPIQVQSPGIATCPPKVTTTTNIPVQKETSTKDK
ncbi:alpha-crystallin B chain [Parasteatoda tepidariorum]|uniref:Protein lethal(2)essential for life n=1 Tax=Parasteatoda tepidariorum TaxID=114398 RepID=A0A2L2Y4I2_PARTP|nr:alpha-crystallin A chain [Parasteatoda tepidariorum]